MKKRAFITLLMVVSANAVAETKALLRVSALSNNTPSFQSNGISHQRFDGEHLALSQAVIDTSLLIGTNWHVNAVANAYSDGEQQLGISQLYLKYRPLVASTVKPEIKVGAFYPALSAENTALGWLSPHFLSNSAINSWIGEELRVGGVEASIRQNGRQVNSPWSWKLLGSVFKGNDTTGTLIAWRGFALHDRQSLYNERVNFLPIPWVVSEEGFNAPAWTEPFREIDKRFGYYIGAHAAYKRQYEVKYYFYDNRADPKVLDSDRLYAWRTRFHSFTFKHQASTNITVFAQAMAGNTIMGENIVNNDFYSAFLATAYSVGPFTHSARVDWYHVIDKDDQPNDPNASQGQAITLNTTYQINDHASVSGEWQWNNGRQANLAFFQPTETFSENIIQLALTLRY